MSSSTVKRASDLLAASCYSRGLWSPVLIWRALSRKPYRGDPVQWGLDVQLIKRHLRLSSAVGLSLLILYTVLTAWYFLAGATWPLYVFIFSLLLEWSLSPWLASRALISFAGASADSGPTAVRETTLVSKDGSSPLSDLGYVLREAMFAVDCSSTSSPESSSAREKLNAEKFYAAVAQSISTVRNFCCYLLQVRPSEEIQPGSSAWGSWYRATQRTAPSSASVSRLVVLGEHPGIDGLASVEFMARDIEPHLSFVVRVRWLPPLSKRLHRFAHLAQQRSWWRCGLVPLILGGVLLLTLQGAALGEELLAANSAIALALGAGLQRLLACIAVAASFGPLALLAAILLARAGRYLRGFLYGATGTFFELQAPRCLRFVASRIVLENGEELHWGISYCQILEEVVTNTVVAVLRDHGIDTRSIRQEMSAFVNQGVYMTGGSLMTENLAVGAFAKIRNRKQLRQLRQGKKTMKTPLAKTA
jgi:hypothetical protein